MNPRNMNLDSIEEHKNCRQGAAVSNEKSLFTHRFNRWRWPQKDCDF